jgi:isopenicillin-N N-acyltransferase-like protein
VGFPLLHLEGSPAEQGRKHGRELRDAIGANLRLYLSRFEEEARLPASEAFARAARYGEEIRSESPAYGAGMQGIAEGSGLSWEDIVLLNVRYELLYDRFSRGTPQQGCTAFALGPEATVYGHTILGQNWDWIPGVRGALLATIEENGLRTLGFTEAGIFGAKIGLNSEGVALCINGLNAVGDDWSRLYKPFHVRCHDILRARNIMFAAAVVIAGPHSCSASYLVGGPGAPSQGFVGFLDIEAGPGTRPVREPTERAPAEPPRASLARVAVVDGDRNSRFAHSNHFLEAENLGVEEPMELLHPRSRERLERMRELLQSRPVLTTEDLFGFLRDHDGKPDSICRHPDESLPPSERYATAASVVMDLNALTLDVCQGPPCRGSYERFGLEPAGDTPAR